MYSCSMVRGVWVLSWPSDTVLHIPLTVRQMCQRFQGIQAFPSLESLIKGQAQEAHYPRGDLHGFQRSVGILGQYSLLSHDPSFWLELLFT